MLFNIAKWFTLPKIKTPTNPVEPIGVSLIIPFKNELHNLKALVQSLNQINYPIQNLEILLINDYSSDGGDKWLAENCSFTLLNNTGCQGKKYALAQGIAYSANPIIICSDADTQVSTNLIWEHVSALTTTADMTLGPVCFNPSNNGVISNLAALENTSLVAWGLINAYYGKPNMANGANLGFKKAYYEKVNGYKNHLHIQSGDDELLLRDFKKLGACIKPLLNVNAQVSTSAVPTFQKYLQQRMRWASKLAYQPLNTSVSYHGSQLLVLLCILCSVYWLFTGVFTFFLALHAIKIITDFMWFYCIASFFKLKPTLHWLISSTVQWYVLGISYIYNLVVPYKKW